jgi:hypothetical protein
VHDDLTVDRASAVRQHLRPYDQRVGRVGLGRIKKRTILRVMRRFEKIAFALTVDHASSAACSANACTSLLFRLPLRLPAPVDRGPPLFGGRLQFLEHLGVLIAKVGAFAGVLFEVGEVNRVLGRRAVDELAV